MVMFFLYYHAMILQVATGLRPDVSFENDYCSQQKC